MQVIKVENLSKLYFLGAKASNSLRDVVVGLWQNRGRIEKKELWALRDVNFTVNEGDTLAIIGRNGAGKSTLLKILSRISRPSGGSIEIRGRVSSLLEIGTGFQQELTGRENTYLNGAILGMKRAEIDKKFDEIVAFSEIEEFLDTPVKFYSSGMHMRLAFSVAAHLEPEILIVDEVLAVGDAEFQKKCLGKMDDVSKTGRTVLFVSHQMGSVAQLCQKAILLDKGSLVMEGKTQAVIEHYLNNGNFNLTSYTADESATLRDMYVQTATATNELSVERSTFRHDQAVFVRVACFAKRMIRGSELRMVVTDGRGITVFTADCELNSLGERTEAFEVVYKIPAETLRPNNYSLTFLLFVPHQLLIEMIEHVVFFSVFDAGTKYAQSEGMDYGLVFSPCEYSVRQIR
ncbi:ABC transporter ATP-binding protein [soil metagenome]